MFRRFVGNGVRRTVEVTERRSRFRSFHVDGRDIEPVQQGRALHAGLHIRVSRVREAKR